MSNQYRKKPVVISAVRYTGDNTGEVRAFMEAKGAPVELGFNHATKPPGVIIHTLEGDMRADVGDWIIRGVKGGLYPCKPDIFEATYDKV